MKTKAYCKNCDNIVTYTIEKEEMVDCLGDIQVEYIGKSAYCNLCNDEIFVEEIDNDNMSIVYNEYVQKCEIISIDDIEIILKKYNIGISALSKQLGISKNAISRYIDGDILRKEYSEKLKYILHENIEEL